MSEKFLNSSRVSELWAKIKDVLSGKQDAFTPGRGLSKDNDTLNLDLPSVAMTQEEYDALTDEEKNSETLFILPGGTEGVPPGGTAGQVLTKKSNSDYDTQWADQTGGSSAGEVYSTEETRIGTWIDGKPLYRKTWVTRTPAASEASQELLSIENLHVDTAVTVKGSINEGSGISQYSQCPYYYDSSYFCYLECCGENNDWAANTLRCKVGAECSLKSIFVTLEYTKTTDAAEEVP